MPRNQCPPRYGRCSCDLRNTCSVWFQCISTRHSALRPTEVRTVSGIPGFTRISWQAFNTLCCNTSKSVLDAEYSRAFSCSHSQKYRELSLWDRAGQLTVPPRPNHCSPEVGLRCSLTVRWKWGGAPTCMGHICCCCWWRGTCSNSTGRSLKINDGTLRPLVC